MIEHEPEIEDTDPTESKDNVLLNWTSHPMKRQPVKTLLVSLFIMIVSMSVFYAMESKAFGVLAMIVLLASLAKYYFPTKFTLTDKRIIIKSTTQTIAKPWSMFRSCYPDKNGVLISPFDEPSRMENFRGLYLIFESNRDEVIEIIKKQLAQNTIIEEDKA